MDIESYKHENLCIKGVVLLSNTRKWDAATESKDGYGWGPWLTTISDKIVLASDFVVSPKDGWARVTWTLKGEAMQRLWLLLCEDVYSRSKIGQWLTLLNGQTCHAFKDKITGLYDFSKLNCYNLTPIWAQHTMVGFKKVENRNRNLFNTWNPSIPIPKLLQKDMICRFCELDSSDPWCACPKR